MAEITDLTDSMIDSFIKSGRANEVFPKFPSEDAIKTIEKTKKPSCPSCVRNRLYMYRSAIRRGLASLYQKKASGDNSAGDRLQRFKEIVGVSSNLRVRAPLGGKVVTAEF